MRNFNLKEFTSGSAAGIGPTTRRNPYRARYLGQCGGMLVCAVDYLSKGEKLMQFNGAGVSEDGCYLMMLDPKPSLWQRFRNWL